MRAFLFSRAGIVPWGHDHQLRGHHGCCRGHISFFIAVSGFHHALHEFQNTDLDGVRHCAFLIVDAARLQLLAGYRFLDQAQAAGPFHHREILKILPRRNRLNPTARGNKTFVEADCLVHHLIRGKTCDGRFAGQGRPFEAVHGLQEACADINPTHSQKALSIA